MKTAKDYIREALGYEPTMSRIDLYDAEAAVQAALDDAGTVRQQVVQGLADYFDHLLPEPPTPLPESLLPPREPPAIRLGGRGPFSPPAVPLPCRDCGRPAADCTCERPPF